MIAMQMSYEGHSVFSVSEDMYDGPGLTKEDLGVLKFGFNVGTQKLERCEAPFPAYYFIGFIKSPETGEKQILVSSFDPATGKGCPVATAHSKSENGKAKLSKSWWAQ